MRHRQGAGLEVDVRPSEREQFALAQPRTYRGQEERPEPVILDRGQKRADLIAVQRDELVRRLRR
jgi:hypothetical protein